MRHLASTIMRLAASVFGLLAAWSAYRHGYVLAVVLALLGINAAIIAVSFAIEARR